MDYKVKDLNLAPQGKLKIEQAEMRMPVMRYLQEKYKDEKPLKGLRVAGCLHVTKETAVLIKTLKVAGAEIAWCGCNPLSTQDDVAASLVKDFDIPIFAWRGLSDEEYYECIESVLSVKPHITLDDGADLVVELHSKHPELLEDILGGTEETTTGIHRLRAMAKAGKLKYPIMAVNDAVTKWDFDNVHGTGQSTIDGVIRATNVLFAGKTVVIAGYGHCGRGLAFNARGIKANVIVTEVDAFKALEAVMDGFRVMPMNDAARLGDVFITATGCLDVITGEHFPTMKDGAILCNTGHFDVEVSKKDLEKMAVSKREMRPNDVEYTLDNGKRIHLLAEGRLVNLAAAEGHPSEVMDMSFANQFLGALHIARNKLADDVHNIPEEMDRKVAEIKLKTTGVSFDTLSEEQFRYLNDYETGT